MKFRDPTAAPVGFPTYSGHPNGVRCGYNNCGHLGGRGAPTKMDCLGRNCPCPCCRFLAGRLTYGMSYGPPIPDGPEDIPPLDTESMLREMEARAAAKKDEAAGKTGKKTGRPKSGPPQAKTARGPCRLSIGDGRRRSEPRD